MAEGTKSNRTASGHVSASAREKSGSGKSGKAFPVFDHTSAMSAISLRGHNDNISREAVLAKVAKYAAGAGDASARAAVAAAREKDSNT